MSGKPEEVRPFKEKLSNKDHDNFIAASWALILKSPYFVNPVTEEQKFANKFHQVIRYSTENGLYANGLSGYHSTMGVTGGERIALARHNLASVIAEGNVRPARGYTSGGISIDKFGNLEDPNEVQAFCAPLRLGSYYDASGNFGPYWIIFDQSALSSDRRKGVSQKYHQCYLVPTETDKRDVLSQLRENIHRPPGKEVENKIITVDQFIAQHQDYFSNDDWYQRWQQEISQQQSLYTRVEEFEAMFSKLHGFSECLEMYLTGIVDPREDPKFRVKLIQNIHVTKKDYHVNKQELYRRTLKDFLLIFNNAKEPAEVRAAIGYRLLDAQGVFYKTPFEEKIKAVARQICLSDTSESVRETGIKILQAYDDLQTPAILARLASDSHLSSHLRHFALFESHYNDPDSLKLLEKSLFSSDAQEQKIALHTLMRTRLLFPPDSLMHKVKQLAAQSPRADLRDQAEALEQKFHYLENYRNQPAILRGSEFEGYRLQLEQLKFTDRYRLVVSKMVSRFAKAVKEGHVELIPLSSENARDGDYVLNLSDRAVNIGKVEIDEHSVSIDFIGYGVHIPHYYRRPYSGLLIIHFLNPPISV